MTRQFLITKFKCAACGGLLSLSYDAPKNGIDYANGEPTGAAMVQQFIAIEPCYQCTRPANDVREALKTLLTIGGAS
jgi:hypothetical protein